MKKPIIQIPIKILTRKIAQNKQNSIFYAGKNIAEVKIRDKRYILTTSGFYQFSLKEDGKVYSFDSHWPEVKRHCKVLAKLTDAKIRRLGTEDWCSNWGWFGVNVWLSVPSFGEVCQPEPTEVSSDYDEALKSFINYIQKDIA